MTAEVVKLAPYSAFAPSNSHIADSLRDLAESIESGAYGDVNVVISLVEGIDGSLERSTVGNPIDLARVVGLLTIEAARAGA